MIDSFVLWTPLLMLPVVAMFAFVGCHLLFGLDRLEPDRPLLTATAGNGVVNLSWRASSPLRFRLMRGTESGVHTMLAEFNSNVDSFEDTTVVNDTTYYYVVVNLGETKPEDDAPSNEVAVRPQADVITSFITSAMIGTTAAAGGFFGMAITVGPNPILVKALGRGVVAGNTQIHIVKIVEASTKQDVLNAAAAVFTSGGANGEIRYAALATPVPLSANTSYYIVSQEMAGGDRFFNHDTSVVTTNVASVRSAVAGDGTTYNEDSPPGQSYALVDFQY
jgi:hypothetical protein